MPMPNSPQAVPHDYVTGKQADKMIDVTLLVSSRTLYGQRPYMKTLEAISPVVVCSCSTCHDGSWPRILTFSAIAAAAAKFLLSKSLRQGHGA